MLTLRDWLQYGGLGLLAALLIAWTFYRSFLAFFLLAPIGAIIYPLYKRRDLCRARQAALAMEFKETIGLLGSFLFAGYSVENAFVATQKEIEKLYGKRAMMAQELSEMIRGFGLNKPPELLLMEFAERSTLSDIRNFAEVFSIAKRSGGDLRVITERTADIIREKAAVAEEIRILTAARRYEQRIMSILPIGIICYVNLTSPEFLQVMYVTLPGRLVMTLCLLLFFLSSYFSKKIMEIEV